MFTALLVELTGSSLDEHLITNLELGATLNVVVTIVEIIAMTPC